MNLEDGRLFFSLASNEGVNGGWRVDDWLMTIKDNLWSRINQKEESKMEDLKIQSIQPLSLPRLENGEASDAVPGSDFKKILSSAIQEVNNLQTRANESVQEMVSGKTDIHTTMIAMEKSGISFRLMLAVRNRMIAAYEEVMRMQF